MFNLIILIIILISTTVIYLFMYPIRIHAVECFVTQDMTQWNEQYGLLISAIANNSSNLTFQMSSGVSMLYLDSGYTLSINNNYLNKINDLVYLSSECAILEQDISNYRQYRSYTYY